METLNFDRTDTTIVVDGAIVDARIIDDRSVEVELDLPTSQSTGTLVLEVAVTDDDVHCASLIDGQAPIAVEGGASERGATRSSVEQTDS